MQEIQKIFNYGETVVRTVYKDEEVWFVAKDVCEVLEIKNVTQAMNRLDEDERSMFNIGRQGETNIVSEAGLYSLILGSKKPEAKSFKRWVTHDVLPSIRKTGGYVANENMFVESYFSTLDDTQKVMLKAMLENTRKLKEENTLMQPKAQYFDALVDRQLLTNFRDTAKQIGVGQKELVEYLLANKYVYRDAKKKLKPYMQFVPELFEMKDWERNGKADVQTLVTPKGKETFRLLLREVS
ncbi:BRO family protein [Priestia flexa]|uniref:BRO family protein n=1 Tax=Priestia flexa TaxID=86664 RepID=A0ABU4J253_9BACI|nr:BRO family protein [Priestia flexa]MDW8515082.1 BRO family protein [Priestia flexa]